MGTPRVLILDSIDETAAMLAAALAYQGIDAVAANTMPEALDLAERVRPDVVVLDLDMRDGDVATLCRAIRARPWAALTRFVALTGWADLQHVELAQACKFDHYLLKPASLDVVISALSWREAIKSGPESRW